MAREPYLRQQFALLRPLQTRWSDNDCYGHMNNVVHYSLFDTAINSWLIERGLLALDGPVIAVVVETGCQYFRELAFPQQIEAGIAVEKLGRSSICYRVALFTQGRQEAAAQGRFVHVCVDSASRAPCDIPPIWRQHLASITLKSPADDEQP